jgi:hypothetical protein
MTISLLLMLSAKRQVLCINPDKAITQSHSPDSPVKMQMAMIQAFANITSQQL